MGEGSWSKKVPSEAGFYWIQHDKDESTRAVANVFLHPMRGMVAEVSNQMMTLERMLGNGWEIWSVPVPQPGGAAKPKGKPKK